MPIPPSKFRPKAPRPKPKAIEIWGKAIDSLLRGRKLESVEGKISVAYKTVRVLVKRNLPPVTNEVRKSLEDQYRAAGWEAIFGRGTSGFILELPDQAMKRETEL